MTTNNLLTTEAVAELYTQSSVFHTASYLFWIHFATGWCNIITLGLAFGIKMSMDVYISSRTRNVSCTRNVFIPRRNHVFVGTNNCAESDKDAIVHRADGLVVDPCVKPTTSYNDPRNMCNMDSAEDISKMTETTETSIDNKKTE